MRRFLTANDRPGEHAPSWYAATADPGPPRPPLDGSAAPDVCVVGAGFTGVSAALHLAEAGLDVLVLDANRIGWGASGRNGGQLGSGQRVEQRFFERKFGMDHARRLWDIAEEAKLLVRGRIRRHNIDCQLKPGVLRAVHRKRDVSAVHAYAMHLRESYGYESVRALSEDEFRSLTQAKGYFGGVLDTGAAHLHPLRLVQGLARAAEAAGARFCETTRAESLDASHQRVRIRTPGGEVRAKHLVIACNGYLDDLAPALAARILPIHNYILATEPLGNQRASKLIRDNIAVVDTRFVVNYFRLSADRRMLFGGGEGYGTRFPYDIAAFVRRNMLRIYPQLDDARIDYAWGGTLAITVNRLPHFARPAPNVISASGYSGHGIALSNWAGMAIAEAIRGTAASFDVLERLPVPRLPAGVVFGAPLLTLALILHGLRDRL